MPSTKPIGTLSRARLAAHDGEEPVAQAETGALGDELALGLLEAASGQPGALVQLEP
jgi:hypothetical protein